VVNISPLEKAEVLIEALPYIKEFYGKTVVIKYGGHAMSSPDLKRAVMQDVTLMKFVGMHPVVVHGGGPEINSMLDRLGITSSFVKGLRVTDDETMNVVEMVLVGKVNKEIVSLINSCGGSALGISGKDGRLITAAPKKVMHKDAAGREEELNLGFVGEVASINPTVINSVIEQGYIPVIAPIGADEEGNTYNINADYVASEVAVALKADKFVLLTDVEGIYADPENFTEIISTIRLSEVPGLIESGVIAGGMIPKIECCVRALEAGVEKAHIIDGRLPHSILLEIFTRKGIGTEVVKD
jgi:acetylglutamate kinase